MNKRTRLVVETLAAGGKIRKALESGYMGREMFRYRLLNKDGRRVPNIGDKTLIDFIHDAPFKLKRLDVPLSSTWPEEWAKEET